MSDFCHLHAHTGFSLLDGLGRIPDLVAAAKADGAPAVALTDHGSMSGAVEFYLECQKQGIKPIIGVEAYVSARPLDETAQAGDPLYHLILLAENNTGYKNLLKLLSEANTRGFYRKPRVDHDLLAHYNEGLICTAACASSEVNMAIRLGEYDRAREIASWYADVFKGRYYLELQEHGLEFDGVINETNRRLAGQLGLPLIATNDVHYIRREHAHTHEVLLCVQTASKMADEKRMRMDSDAFYFRSAQEMAALFGHIPGALTNTCEIAERCNVDLDLKTFHLPKIEIPSGLPPDAELRILAQKGLEERYPHDFGEAQDRLEYELGVITGMGFADYYLLVHDIVSYARSRGISVGPGRGSAAGSITAFALGLTSIDPLRWGLAFERFLNPERVSMPDMDLDFQDDRRDEVIEYARQKYGADKVAQIITFGTIGPRAGIKDVARALGVEVARANELSQMVPFKPGTTLADALDQYDLRDEYDSEEDAREILDHVKVLEGVPRHASVHAAGVVISPDPLDEHVPLYKAPRGTTIVTGYDMGSVEKIGLLKLDFLGLRTLTIIERTLQFIKQRRGKCPDINSPAVLEHPAVYKLLTSGNTAGVFQVESDGMRRLLQQLKPTEFEHVIAVVALYRPGPMEQIDTFVKRRHGRETVEYIHPALEEVLRPTYGVVVYQEQVMRLFSLVAGYSMGEADLVRRAMGKKKLDEMVKHHSEFLHRAQERGTSAEVAQRLWDIVLPFAGYAFNKSHAAAYAVLTCQTAYLKANFPLEFMAGTLSAERGNDDKVREAIRECRRLRITILPPHVNHSRTDFTLEEKGIRYGFEAIKGMGEAVGNAIANERQNGPYTSVVDLVSRISSQHMNKRVIEALLKAKALEVLAEKKDLTGKLDRYLEFGTAIRKHYENGQRLLFPPGRKPEEPGKRITINLGSRQGAAFVQKLLSQLEGGPDQVTLTAMGYAGDPVAVTWTDEASEQVLELLGVA